MVVRGSSGTGGVGIQAQAELTRSMGSFSVPLHALAAYEGRAALSLFLVRVNDQQNSEDSLRRPGMCEARIALMQLSAEQTAGVGHCLDDMRTTKDPRSIVWTKMKPDLKLA